MRAIITGLFAALIGASSAHAQTITYDGLAFDNAKHRGWYVRFWTGSCDELSYVICMSGTPHWNDIMQRLLAQVPAARRERLQVRLILLGRRVGYEWARENDVRRINNGHIKSWSADLKNSGAEPEQAVGRIEGQTRALIGAGDPLPSRAGRY